jgi:hypothetical protein
MTNHADTVNYVEEAKDIAMSACRMENDINGNPRYYIPCFMFSTDKGMFRPPYATSYCGKKYGSGWVFQSYALENDIRESLKEYYRQK